MTLAPPVLSLAILFAGLVHQPPRPEHSPLAVAAIGGDVESVRQELARGADPNSFADHGFTPLMWAARFGQVEAMRVLVDSGASLDATDRGPNGWTAIMHAVHKGQTKAALALLDWGANPNAATPSGLTPLMQAAAEHDLDVVRALLDRGADPRAETLDGVNVLTYAVNGGNTAIAKAVLERAPDLQWEDNLESFMALVPARLRGNKEIVELVRERRPHD